MRTTFNPLSWFVKPNGCRIASKQAYDHIKSTYHDDIEAKQKAEKFFRGLKNDSQQHSLDLDKIRAMLAVLGKNHQVNGESVFDIIRAAMLKNPTSSQTQNLETPEHELLTPLSKREAFALAYNQPETVGSEYKALYKLLDSKESEVVKREKLYSTFKNDPIAMLVCISRPIDQMNKGELIESSNDYRLIQYIFEDSKAWKTIATVALSYHKTFRLPLPDVEKLLLPIVDMAFSIDWSLPAHEGLAEEMLKNETDLSENPSLDRGQLASQALVEHILLPENSCYYNPLDEKVSLIQCTKIVLKNSALMSDYFLLVVPEKYTSYEVSCYTALQKNFVVDWLKEGKLERKENNQKWREDSIKQLKNGLDRRKILEEQRESLVAKNTWFFGEKLDPAILSKKNISFEEMLALLKQIVEVSGHVKMAHNNLWAHIGIHDISNRCVQLVENVLSNSFFTQESILKALNNNKNFVHSIARRGGEAIKILQALDKSYQGSALVEQCCAVGEKCPLVVALKAGNNEVMALLINPTKKLFRWRELLKPEILEHKDYQDKITNIESIKALIEKDYTVVDKIAYRNLNAEYNRADNIMSLVTTNQLSMRLRGQNLSTLIKTGQFANYNIDPKIIQNVVADHTNYLQYLVRFSKTWDAQHSFSISSILDVLTPTEPTILRKMLARGDLLSLYILLYRSTSPEKVSFANLPLEIRMTIAEYWIQESDNMKTCYPKNSVVSAMISSVLTKRNKAPDLVSTKDDLQIMRPSF